MKSPCATFAIVLGATLLGCSSSGTNSEGDNGAGTTFLSPSLDGGAAGPGLGLTPGAADGGTGGSDGGCGANLTGVVRDFHMGNHPGGHPDFEMFEGNGEKGIVMPTLGADSKPTYNDVPHQFTTTKTNFDQWYRDVPGVNVSILFRIDPQLASNGLYTYDAQAFFPIDNQGFGNEGESHNYSFTFELHTEFVYNGGEVFTFSGDDDQWTFVNGHLAIDLGGVHQSQTDTIDLDARAQQLGLVKGQKAELAVFQAERHTSASHFRIDTSIAFTNCTPILR